MEAAKYQVFPLDNSILPRILAPKPSYTAGRSRVHLFGRAFRHAQRRTPPTPSRGRTPSPRRWKSLKDGGEGVIVTDGGRFGGYGLYLLKGKPVFTYNFFDIERFKWQGDGRARARQAHAHLRFQVRWARHGKGGTGTLSVDGKEVGQPRKSPTRSRPS